MPANTSPIFSRIGQLMWSQVNITAANTTKDLTSGTIYQLLPVADSSNGSRIDKLVIQPRGTNVATALRLWINNGGAATTAANNFLLREVTMAATTLSEVAALANTEIALDIALPAGYSFYITIGTTVAAGFHVWTQGGDY